MCKKTHKDKGNKLFVLSTDVSEPLLLENHKHIRHVEVHIQFAKTIIAVLLKPCKK